MDNIQKSVVAVLALAGGLALIVPSAVPTATENPSVGDKQVSSDTRENDADTQNSSADPDAIDNADITSDFANETFPAYGEPVQFSEADVTPAPAAEYAEPVTEISTAADSDELADQMPSQGDSSSRGGPPRPTKDNRPGNTPEALANSGLRNGSGGQIEVSERDLRYAKKIKSN